jgi:hypothetical protein
MAALSSTAKHHREVEVSLALSAETKNSGLRKTRPSGLAAIPVLAGAGRDR